MITCNIKQEYHLRNFILLTEHLINIYLHIYKTATGDENRSFFNTFHSRRYNLNTIS